MVEIPNWSLQPSCMMPSRTRKFLPNLLQASTEPELPRLFQK